MSIDTLISERAERRCAVGLSQQEAEKSQAAWQRYKTAWQRVKQFARFRPLTDQSPDEWTERDERHLKRAMADAGLDAQDVFFQGGEAAFLSLAAELRARGYDKHLPAVAEAIEEGQPNIDPVYRPGQMVIAECIRLALDRTTDAGKIAEGLRQWAETEEKSTGLFQEADNVEFLFLQCIQNRPAPAPTAAPALPTPTPKPAPATVLSGVAPRNAWFLAQHEARGTGTYRKPKRIQEKWWHMTDNERAAICPDNPAKASLPAVSRGLSRARALRGDPPKKLKIKRRRTRRKA